MYIVKGVIFSEKGAFMYNSMTSFGDTLFIVQILANRCDIIAYDTVGGTRQVLKRFDFDDAAGTGETIRQITSDGNTLVFLRLKIDEEQHTSLYLDRYTADMTLVESVDISSITSERMDGLFRPPERSSPTDRRMNDPRPMRSAAR